MTQATFDLLAKRTGSRWSPICRHPDERKVANHRVHLVQPRAAPDTLSVNWSYRTLFFVSEARHRGPRTPHVSLTTGPIRLVCGSAGRASSATWPRSGIPGRTPTRWPDTNRPDRRGTTRSPVSNTTALSMDADCRHCSPPSCGGVSPTPATRRRQTGWLQVPDASVSATPDASAAGGDCRELQQVSLSPATQFAANAGPGGGVILPQTKTLVTIAKKVSNSCRERGRLCGKRRNLSSNACAERPACGNWTESPR